MHLEQVLVFRAMTQKTATRHVKHSEANRTCRLNVHRIVPNYNVYLFSLLYLMSIRELLYVNYVAKITSQY